MDDMKIAAGVIEIADVYAQPIRSWYRMREVARKCISRITVPS